MTPRDTTTDATARDATARDAIGRTRWAVAGGHVPFGTTGREPAMTSRDELCVLNAGDAEATLALTVLYADRDPVGPYHVTVAARRVRRVRVNDLIDPLPVPLDVPHALVVESDVPVVVQWTRQDTRQAALAQMGGLAFPLD